MNAISPSRLLLFNTKIFPLNNYNTFRAILRADMRKTLMLAGFAALIAFAPARPILAAVQSGSLIKASGPAVYYVTGGKRYVFANEKVYFSWYHDFNSVVTVTDQELASFLIGGNVTYKPGSKLVKIQTDPKVYVIGPGGTLRWIATEDAARGLFGVDWNKQIDDIPDAFFFNYRQGADVNAPADFDTSEAAKIGSIEADLGVRSGSTIVASKDITAARLGTWSDSKTWGGKTPSYGDRVVIPEGIKVIFDAASTASLRSVDVRGTLEFWKDNPSSMSLTTKSLLISGTLRAGTLSAPIPKKIGVTINLTGASQAADDDDGIVVRGGTIEMNGETSQTAWTTLGAAAAKDDTVLTTFTDVKDWPVGGEIVIASTSRDGAQTEIRHIVKVEGTVVTLDAPLAFAHRADGFAKEEVGLLSRNVAILGTGGGAGGRLSVSSGGNILLSGVELRGLGKDGVSGMGAMALDGLGGASGSYLKNSVLRDTARCVSLRRVDTFVIEGNVALNVRGSCFTTESGSETGNTFRHNLVASVEKGSASTGDDVPAAFLLRNANNIVERNAVVDSAGHGYWYWLGDDSTKLNGTTEKPMSSKLGSFKDNAVRAAAKSGLFVDSPDGKAEYSPSQKAVFSGLTAFESGDYGFWARGIGMEVSGAYLGDNRVGGSFAAFGATFKDSVVLGDPESASSTLPWQRGFVFQDGPVAVSNITFERFLPGPKRDAAAFGFKEGGLVLMDPMNSLRNITLDHASAWSASAPKTLADQLAAVRDIDAKKSIVMKYPFLGDDCVAGGGNVNVCDATFSQLQVAFRGITSAHGATFERLDGHGAVTFEPGPSFDGIYAYLTVAEGGAYRMKAAFTSHVSFDYSGTAEPVTMRFATSANVQVKSGLGSTWTHDAASGDLTLVIMPGDFVDVSW